MLLIRVKPKLSSTSEWCTGISEIGSTWQTRIGDSWLGRGVLRDLVRSGIADGSLRSDLDPDLTMEAVINAAIGTQRRLASLGKKVEAEYGQSVDRLFRETIRIILLGLQAPVPTGKKAKRQG